MRFALLPTKPLALAKSRLATHLSEPDRTALCYAMFHDVLECLCRASHVDAVAVVTADPRLLDLARLMRALAIDEENPRGLNAAAALGTNRCIERGATSVLIVLSDLPLLTTEEVDAVYADLPEGAHVRIARSHEGLGTNALLRVPPTVISTRFGGRSFQDHVAAAADAEVSHSEIDLPGLSFDIDTVDDLRELRRAVRPTRTLVEARKMGLLPATP
ncbi:MAG: 2-phospho-L-lactate guanylyltransferase [Deltaproteobacteria bacterium]|nr:2-phospho-L-lactate guanylyltransferase [Deltaproteobacteria bacterium]